MRAVVAAMAAIAVLGAGLQAQLPRPSIQLPGRGAAPPRRDSLPDSARVHWPTPDSAAQALLQMKGYGVTRYLGDTVFYNADQHTLDLLAAKQRRAVVQRDSQTVVSDSGVYYRETTRDVTTGGNYRLSNPTSGWADITGIGRFDYNLAGRSVTLRRARLPVNVGDMWYMDVNDRARIIFDSTAAKSSTVYVRSGSMTSCDDSIPDYHFSYGEAKRTGSNTLVARPAVLYIKDVPVMWLPFIFSDTRGGRHSGILVPQFGIGDIIRNSPSYRRNVDHFGYYWAFNDYMDFSTWLDWRSEAGATQGDPGWLRLNSDWDYKWIDRFMSGRVGVAYTSQGDGLTNTAISWSHQQDFSHDSHLNASANYVTSTTLQRQNTFNPYTALATIASQATYQEKMGPASLSIGATRKQYPGRPQVDETFPTISLTTTPISAGSWLSWTPSFSFSRSDTRGMDQPGVGAYVYSVDPLTGLRDSSLNTHRSSSQASMSFDTPLQIFGENLRNSFRVTQQRNDFPQQIQIYDLNTGAVTDTRVFAATYSTGVDWTPDFTLPPLAQNRFNLTPSVSLQNVDPGPFWVATERTNGRYVHQSKRLTYGLSASPTLFGLFPGFGPFSRLRHSITPSVGYSFAPGSSVSDEYLLALGRTRHGYLGNLKQNAVSFGLTQNIEAKIRSKADTAPGAGQPIRLLSITMTPLQYDFERAAHDSIHRQLAGLTTETWGYNLSSDLLPGFEFSSNYSLFQGSTLSDTARFKPYLTGISASLNLGQGQNPLAVFTRLFGKAVPEAQAGPTPGTDQVRPRPDDAQAQALAAQPVAGGPQGGDRFIVPPSQGWRASFQFSRSSPRPPVGTNVINYDPRVRCAQIAGNNPLLLDACLAQQRAQPTTDTPILSTTAGGPAYNIPPTTSLNGNISFNLTDKWSTSWQTTYDFEQHQFASHVVSLQRELHDWRAIFGFTQSPNGNFAFNFRIALKAEPDLKFDYNKQTVRNGVVPF